MDSTENTVTSDSNTVLSSGGGIHHTTDNVYVDVVVGGDNTYVTFNGGDISNNYNLENLSFDNSSMILPTTTTYNEEKIESITMCNDDTMMSTNDMVVDDLSADDSVNGTAANRRVRFKYTKAQLRRFEDYFRVNMFPDSITREEISKELNIPVRNVQVWFKNRRAKHRKSAQMVIDTSSTSSSYLENSTLLPTPDRNSIPTTTTYGGSGGGYCTTTTTPITQYATNSNPHHSMIMFNPLYQSIPTNNYIMGGGNINSTLPNTIGVSPLTTSHSYTNTTNNPLSNNNTSRLVNYHNYGVNPIISSPFYRNDNKYIGCDMASPIFGNATTPQTRTNTTTPLVNNPFVINVPHTNYLPSHHQHPQQQQQPHYYHHNYNPSHTLQQRPIFYHNVAQSTIPHNENIPTTSNTIKTEYKKNEPIENNHKSTTPSSISEFHHDTYMNR